MKVPDHMVCDVCDQAKGAIKDWIIAVILPDRGGIFFVPAEQPNVPRLSESAKYEDICGHACAAKRLSQYLESLNPFTPKGSSE